VGGPVVLPGVYNGHDRTFFFGAFELLRENRAFFNRARVPTLAERSGDFSDLMAPDCAVQTLLIDPLALTQGVIQPFTNINQLLPGPDPVGAAMVNLYPQPNISGAACGSPNYTAQVNRKIDFNDFFGRVDHRWGTKDNLFVRYNLNSDYQSPGSYGPLPSDVPDRLIVWGRFPTHIWSIEVAPFFDLHTGFPFSVVDELQNYVGQPNRLRFPTFLSLDVKLGREFTLPFPWIKNHRLRGALTVLNITNHSNPRDVFNNITSPVFGHFVGFQHRSLGTALDITY
jgi:hypothetical protein